MIFVSGSCATIKMIYCPVVQAVTFGCYYRMSFIVSSVMHSVRLMNGVGFGEFIKHYSFFAWSGSSVASDFYNQNFEIENLFIYFFFLDTSNSSLIVFGYRKITFSFVRNTL